MQTPRDENRIATLLAVSNVDGTTPVTLWADPITHRLLVDLPASGSTLAGLADVTLVSPTNGQVLSYNNSTGKWENTTIAGTGTVTSVSVVSANGLAGTVATATTTPAITLSTSITGLLKGNGTAISTASAGSDFVAPSTTVNGHALSANVSVALSELSDATISSPALNEILTWNGTKWINGNQTQVNAGTGISYYPTSTASDIATYYEINKSPDTSAEVDSFVTANNNSVIFGSYATPSVGLGGTQIDPGAWNFTLWGYVDNITGGDSSIDMVVYKRTAGGTETSLFTVNSGILSTTLSLYQVVSIQGAFSINSTDRLVVKVYGKTTAVANRNVHLVMMGTAHYSYVTTPLITRHNDLAGLQGGVSNEYYHLTSAEYTGTGTNEFVRKTTPTLVTPVLGVATATSINKVAFTAPATSATLTIPDGVTMTGPATSGTVMTLGNVETVTGAKTYNDGKLLLAGSTSGATTIKAAAVASTYVATLPAATTTLLGTDNIATVTNKKNVKREGHTTSSATPTIDTTLYDFYELTAQAVDITSFTTNLSNGTPTKGQTLWIAITGTAARAITWGTGFESSTVTLPTTTVTTNRLDVGFVWNDVTSKWRCVGAV